MGKYLRIRIVFQYVIAALALTLMMRDAAVIADNTMPRTQPVLVVLIEFNNAKHTYSVTKFDKLFFSTTTRSVYTYYKETSYSKFTISRASDDFPVSNNNDGMVGWVNLDQNHPDCENTSDPNSCYRGLVTTSLQSIDDSVDFSQFDTNNDGEVSPDELSIIFVVAGYEAAYSSDLPAVFGHKFFLSTPLVLDGKNISYYAMFGEKHKDHQATIGVMVHELGHLMLGLPDLYDTRNTPLHKGIGPFDVMSEGSWGQSNTDLYGGETPVHPSAWTKVYAGFISPLTISSDQANLQLPAVNNNPTTLIRINTSNTNEYFLLENRQFTGYDSGLQKKINATDTKGGISIWHIDQSLLTSCIVDKNCNNDPNHKLVDLEEADGIQDLDTSNGKGKVADLFFSGNVTHFNNDSNPNSKLYSGVSSYIAVTNVSAPSNVMSLDVVMNSENSPKINFSPTSLNYKVNYGSTSITPQTINISNGGGGSLNWTATSDVNWLVLSPSNGTNTGVINVSINTAGLFIGTYNGTITIQAPLAFNTPISIPVTLVINYSVPVNNWTTVVNGDSWNFSLYAVASNDTGFVAVGDSGHVFTSPNGATWTNVNSGISDFLESIAYGNNTYAAGGVGNNIYTSTNGGANWSARSLGNRYGIYGMTFGNNTFVAVGEDTSGNGVIFTSTNNGVSWVKRNPGTTTAFISVAFGNNMFIAVGPYNDIYLSTDNGATWTSRNSFTNSYLSKITFNNNVFMAMEWSNGNIYGSSNNGQTWPLVGSSIAYNIASNDITSGDNTFLTVGTSFSVGKAFFVSSDDLGTTWTIRDPNKNMYLSSACYGNNTFVAVGSGILQSLRGNQAVKIDPAKWDFGGIPHGTTSTPQTFTITNLGFTTLSISNVAIQGANSDEFTITNNCASPIAPKQTCTLDIRFGPSSGGIKNANLTMNTSDSLNPSIQIPLSGIGQYHLNVQLQGEGTGAVLSAPDGINCGSGCSLDLNPSSEIGLYGIPALNTFFAGWSGDCNGDEKCTVTMNSDKTIVATFLNPDNAVARIYATTITYYPSISAAFFSAAPNDIVQAKVYDFYEDVFLTKSDDDTIVYLKGGYDDDYYFNSEYTTIHGSLTIAIGSLILDNISIQ